MGEHLWVLFPCLGINCVLDVGARHGEDGDFLKKNGYTGHIISFEPIAESFHVLAGRCAHDPRWQTHQCALGNCSTTAEINVSSGSSFSSFLRPTQETVTRVPGSLIDHTELVDVRRLDEVFDGVVAHIDDPRVPEDGHARGDLEVVRGAPGCLKMILALQSEMTVHPLYEGDTDSREAVAEFNRAGFAESGFFNLPHHREMRLAELDCVMIRTPSGEPRQ